MTVDQWCAWVPQLDDNLPSAYFPHITAAMERFDIHGPLREAMFLAQTYHESSGYTRWEENLSYTAGRLMKVWESRFPTLAKARQYARNPEKLANFVYASRNGNRNVASGDGWRYRGRGPIQITGRANYQRCGDGLGRDLLTEPNLLAQPRYGFASAGWYWADRNLNALADKGDVRGVTRRINGGYVGLDDRKRLYARAKVVLNG